MPVFFCPAFTQMHAADIHLLERADNLFVEHPFSGFFQHDGKRRQVFIGTLSCDNQGFILFFIAFNLKAAIGQISSLFMPFQLNRIFGKIEFALRIIQGFGGACVNATSIAILSSAFPSGEKGKALGIFCGSV